MGTLRRYGISASLSGDLAGKFMLTVSRGGKGIVTISSGLPVNAYPEEQSAFLGEALTVLAQSKRQYLSRNDAVAAAQGGLYAVSALALGFSSASECREHQWFLQQKGSPEYLRWLTKKNAKTGVAANG